MPVEADIDPIDTPTWLCIGVAAELNFCWWIGFLYHGGACFSLGEI